MALTLALIVLSLLALTAGAELLVRGAVALARRARISAFFVGLTIVGFGTSTPELFTSLAAVARDQPDLSVGNVVGSNIFNVAFILGLTALLVPIPVVWTRVRSDAWLAAGAAAVFLPLAVSGGRLSRIEGLALLLALGAALAWSYRRGRRDEDTVRAVEVTVPGVPSAPPPGAALPLLQIGGGLVILVAGSESLVAAAIELARSLEVSELTIGLTVVAAGTSAPELFTSLVAAWRRAPDISVGNILGSNLFNLAGILGMCAVVRPLPVAIETLRLDIPAMLAVSVFLVGALRTGSRLGRLEGAFLGIAYAAYVGVVLARAPAGG